MHTRVLFRGASLAILMLVLLTGAAAGAGDETLVADQEMSADILALAVGPQAEAVAAAMPAISYDQWDPQDFFVNSDNRKSTEINLRNRGVIALYSAEGSSSFRPWVFNSSGGLVLNKQPPFTVPGYEGDVSPWVFQADEEGTYTIIIDKMDSTDPSRVRGSYRLTLVVKPHWNVTMVDDTAKNTRVGGGGMYSSLAIGTDGTPHISYYSPGYGGVRYATRHERT